MQTVKFQPTSIKKGDMVQIIAGKEKGKTGKVLQVMRSRNRVLLENLNLVKRHTKPSQSQPQGGIIQKASSLNYSNVLILCPKCNRGVRVGQKVIGDKKVRVCKSCDSSV